jgi:hypothetical protein
MSTFKSSRPAVVELAARYRDIVTELESKHTIKGAETEEQLEAAEQVLFTEMCEICLWGNATDLSLLTNLSYEDIQKLQGSQARKNSEKNILVNDLSKAFKILRAAQEEGEKERRVDIVLDNAGFELFVDLILAGYLVASGLATTVVLHPKSIPWFVSDVLPADFIALLSALAAPQKFYGTQSEEDKNAGKEAVPLSETEDSNLQFLFQSWSQMHAEGQLMLRPNDFWTAGGSYWRLPKAEPELLEDLKESELVIFKGDLNYRKLTADVSSFRIQYLLVPTDSCRRNGHPRHLSQMPLDPWVQALVFVSLRCEPAKLMSSSVYQKVKTKGSEKLREERRLAHANGPGAVSMLSSNFLTVSQRISLQQKKIDRHVGPSKIS